MDAITTTSGCVLKAHFELIYMKYQHINWILTMKEIVLDGPRLAHWRKKTFIKSKRTTVRLSPYLYIRKKREKKRGGIYIRKGCATGECRASIKNNELSPRLFASRSGPVHGLAMAFEVTS